MFRNCDLGRMDYVGKVLLPLAYSKKFQVRWIGKVLRSTKQRDIRGRFRNTLGKRRGEESFRGN